MQKVKMMSGILVAVLLLSGCSTAGTTTSNDTGSAEVYYADEDFMKSLTTGLENRWELSPDTDPEFGTDEYVSLSKKYVDAELSQIESYNDEKFKDNKLKEKAIAYINALQTQKESLDYINADLEKYSELWDQGYNDRSKLLEEFVNDYGLAVSEEYQSHLDELLTNSKLVKTEEKNKQAVEDVFKNAEFTLVKTEYDWSTYEAVVENTSNISLKNIQLGINMLDEDGIIVESTSDNLSSLGQGQKAKIQFETDKDFASTEVNVDYWEEN